MPAFLQGAKPAVKRHAFFRVMHRMGAVGCYEQFSAHEREVGAFR
jgi:hypothetical protein